MCIRQTKPLAQEREHSHYASCVDELTIAFVLLIHVTPASTSFRLLVSLFDTVIMYMKILDIPTSQENCPVEVCLLVRRRHKGRPPSSHTNGRSLQFAES